MKRNTSTTRAFKALNTRYNVYFNGTTSYNEGITSINQSNTDDYSNLINMYAISKHDNANAAKSSMDRTIEKCRKAIKLHSIKKKPERNSKKWNDPTYKAWYNQKEFNPALKDAWLLLAKAEFHKADFLGAVGTFTYVSRYYPDDTNIVTECQLWIARAYAEMGWQYEAEQLVAKINQKDINAKNAGFYAAVNADLLLKHQQKTEAIPFLEMALKNEKNKIQKQRFTYLLAQLYQKSGSTDAAYKTYSSVLKTNPSYEMDFNARINRAELNTDVQSVRKELKKMLRNPNNKEYKDQLYYVLGKTYLAQGDTIKAIENFQTSIDTSSRNGFDKAVTLITLGDLYYNKQNYIKAQPCYDEASKIISATHEEYSRVSKRAETLSELVSQHEIVLLQDSLQRLAALPMDKRKEIIQNLIDKKIAAEKAAEEADKLKTQQQNRPQNFDENFDMMPPIGMAQSTGDWYFYNPNLIKTGSSEFRKKWGTRKLEDNWRRVSKSAVLFSDNTQQPATTTTDTTAQTKQQVSDENTPEFYLAQIPQSQADIEKSNTEIATALYNMGFIYKDKVEDYPLAINTFDAFESRFPTDKRLVETYYYAYVLKTKMGETAEADKYKQKLIAGFPNSKYVEVISQPNYFENLERMYQEQDNLYAATYHAYNNNKFDSVMANTAYMQKNYPLSELMPKFLFLNALSNGKTKKTQEFEKSLNELVTKYPSSDVSSMAKDIIALMQQGNEAKAGGSHSTLLSRREASTQQEIAQDTERKFIADKTGKHRLMIVFNTSTEKLNKLLFNVAAYNFTRFMVKDFELISTRLDSTQTVLNITNFDSYDEAVWYVNSINSDAELNSLLNTPDIRKIIVSDINYGTLFSYLGLDAYLSFAKNGLNAAPKLALSSNKTTSLPLKKDEKPAMYSPTTNTSVANVKQAAPSATATAPVAAPVSSTITQATTDPKTTATPTPKQVEPVAQQQTASTQTLPAQNKTVTASTPVQTPAVAPKATVAPKVEPLPPSVPLFKNLYGFVANEPHYIAINVLSGNFDYEKLKSSIDAFNAKNYSMLNLKVTKDTYGKNQVILIGSFADANIAKAYLFRIVKETDIYAHIKSTDYRNLLGSQRNLNVMMQRNAMDIYFEFMQEYYLE